MNVPWKEKLNLEKEMLEQAFEIINAKEQLFLIKSAINNFTTEALYTKELYETIDPLTKDELTNKLSARFKSSKFNSNRIKQLIFFVERVYLHQHVKNK